MADRRPILLAGWSPVARIILALIFLVLAIYFGVMKDTQDALIALIGLALSI